MRSYWYHCLSLCLDLIKGLDKVAFNAGKRCCMAPLCSCLTAAAPLSWCRGFRCTRQSPWLWAPVFQSGSSHESLKGSLAVDSNPVEP